MKRDLRNSVQDLKSRKDKTFFALSLRADLAELIWVGLQRLGWSQRDLAERAEYRESYVSRLVNGDTDFKIGTAARVLAPFGVVPKIVDEAEWFRLKDEVEAARAKESALGVARTHLEVQRALQDPRFSVEAGGIRFKGGSSHSDGRWRTSESTNTAVAAIAAGGGTATPVVD